MKNAIRKIFSKQVATFAIVGAIFAGQAFGSMNVEKITAVAEQTPTEEIIYRDDIVYGTEEVFFGGSAGNVVSTYQIDCDQMVLVEDVSHPNAPSYGYTSMDNMCGVMAGTNVVIFYDRYCPNLIPDFEPGRVFSTGFYRYYQDFSDTATVNLKTTLYGLMNVAQVGGTTSANFKSGLRSYVEGKGYTYSHSSMYQSATSVNLTTLANAVNQGKVGVLMCSTYNFVYSINMVESEGYASVGKVNSPNAHMMMVYGYKTLAFYKQGAHVCTKTFLYACSGYGSGQKGYMELNSYSTINEALIISVT